MMGLSMKAAALWGFCKIFLFSHPLGSTLPACSPTPHPAPLCSRLPRAASSQTPNINKVPHYVDGFRKKEGRDGAVIHPSPPTPSECSGCANGTLYVSAHLHTHAKLRWESGKRSGNSES